MEQIAAKKNTRSPTKKNNARILSHKASENRPPIFSTVYGCYEGLFQNPYQQQQQASSKPPLLPLPIVPLSRNYSLPCATRSLSFSCPNNPPPRHTRSGPIRKQPKFRPNPAPKPKPNDWMGSEPGIFGGGGEEFSLISPPPSSLPVPKFAMRPKIISCNAEAVGVNAGATDSLRRILRLP